MGRTVRSNSNSPDEFGFPGDYAIVHSVNVSGASLDSSRSFRDESMESENRIYKSENGLAKANNTTLARGMVSLSQSLALEPIAMDDQKSTKSGDLRRVLGVGENSFGAARDKPHSSVTTEELKWFKTSVVDASIKARGRTKRFNDSINNLVKYQETLNSKKLQRNESLKNARPGGPNLMKLGTQIPRNRLDVGTQRTEDTTKTGVLNKRVCTSIAEIREDGPSKVHPRHPFFNAKDRDIQKGDGSDSGSDMIEEKYRKSPAGGESWDKKIKRKRCAGSMCIRPMEGDRDFKRSKHKTLNNEPGLPSHDTQNFRSGLLNGTSAINRLDTSFLPTCSNNNETTKNKLEKDMSASLNKERFVSKGHIKLNNRGDSHVVSSSPTKKIKGYRNPRSGPVAATKSPPNYCHSSEGSEVQDRSLKLKKFQSIYGADNRKCSRPTGSFSLPMSHGVGQRTQNSRTRRASLVCPASILDDMQLSPTNGTQHFGVKLEKISSPARLSQDEESPAGKNRLKEKEIGTGELEGRSVNCGHNVGPLRLLNTKNRRLNEGSGSVKQTQVQSRMVSPVSRVNSSSVREMLGNPDPIKPLQNNGLGSGKIQSKSGRSMLKKISDRKSFTRPGQIPKCGSLGFTGDSDDDREELSAAAKFASNASYSLCSSSFWKKMEQTFGFVSLDDKSFLEQQIKCTEENHERLFPMVGHGDNASGDYLEKESSQFQTLASGESLRRLLNQAGLTNRTMDLVDQFQDHAFSGRSDINGRSNKVPPLYQRVLSALIVEDEAEDFDEACGRRDISSRYSRNDSPSETFFHIDAECGLDMSELESGSSLGLICNGNSTYNIEPSMDSPLCGAESQSSHMILPCVSSYNNLYEQLHLEDRLLLELQSIGLYPEEVPDLIDGEEVSSQEIHTLNKSLHQMACKKQAHLGNIYKSIKESKEDKRRHLEQIAVNRLVELAYRKQLATRGTGASKSGITKVPKKDAMAFVKRTLVRYLKYEDTGRSCFREPPLENVLLAADEKSIHVTGTNSVHHEAHKSPSELSTSDFIKVKVGQHHVYETLDHSSDQVFTTNGLIIDQMTKKEAVLDDAGCRDTLKATSGPVGNPNSGGTKGKRSKVKHKQKMAKVSTASGGGPSVLAINGFIKKREVGPTLPVNSHWDSSKEEVKDPFDFTNLQLDNSIEDHQDLGSWLNIDEDSLQDDHDDFTGLEIPMDDISELNMF